MAVPIAYVQISTGVTQTGGFKLTSGTVTTEMSLPFITAGQCITTNGQGKVLGTSCGSGGGGSSALAVNLNGVQVSSPTPALNFIGPPFSVTLLAGNTAQVGLVGSSVTLHGDNVIYLQSTLQSGATFFTSSGTASAFNAGTLKVTGTETHAGTETHSGVASFSETASFARGVSASTGVYSSSVTALSLAATGLTTGQCVQVGAGGVFTVSGSPCTTVSSGSMTIVAGYGIISTVDGTTATFNLQGNTTSYVQNRGSLQAATTFYVSSGTVNTLQVGVTLAIPSLPNTVLATDANGVFISTTITGGGGGGGSVGGTINNGSTYQTAYYSLAGSSNAISGTSNVQAFPSSVTILGAVPIVSTSTLQTGATVYVSSIGASGQITANTVVSNSNMSILNGNGLFLQNSSKNALFSLSNTGSSLVSKLLIGASDVGAGFSPVTGLGLQASTATISSMTVTTLSVNGPVISAGSAGTSGQVLTSAGAGVVPTWQTPSGGSGGGQLIYPATGTPSFPFGASFSTMTVSSNVYITNGNVSQTAMCINISTFGVPSYRCNIGGTGWSGSYGIFQEMKGTLANNTDSYGITSVNSQETSGNGWTVGLYGDASNSSFQNYGVWGNASGSGTNYAGYFQTNGGSNTTFAVKAVASTDDNHSNVAGSFEAQASRNSGGNTAGQFTAANGTSYNRAIHVQAGDVKLDNLTASQMVRTDASKNLISSATLTTTELVGTLQAAQFPALTGDVTTVSGALATTLASVVTANQFGSATVVPVITFDAKGRITAVSSATISASGGGGGYNVQPATVPFTLAQGFTATTGTITSLTLGTSSYASYNSSGTITPDGNLGNNISIVLHSSATINVPTNAQDMQKFVYRVSQDTVGRQIILGSGFDFSNGISTAAFSSAGSLVDYLGCTYRSAASVCDINSFDPGH